MRPIEFRAWNKTTQKMIDLNVTTRIDPRAELEGIFLPFDENLILEAWTGVFGKNDKKIFEGDIVRTTRGLTREVIWYNLGWHIKDAGMLCSHRGLEVLGNIHENPEEIWGHCKDYEWTYKSGTKEEKP